MLVRVYRKISDKSTGAEGSKFGPMFIHFNQKCLEKSDSEKKFFFLNFWLYKNHIWWQNEKLNKSEVALLKNLGIKF